jgi:hypothetical protein
VHTDLLGGPLVDVAEMALHVVPRGDDLVADGAVALLLPLYHHSPVMHERAPVLEHLATVRALAARDQHTTSIDVSATSYARDERGTREMSYLSVFGAPLSSSSASLM